ncbi:hypothetical protein GFER_05910 [Geoalkalibacter ferrihydriticus DSM 17813]|uniref:Uncharacterized protein n=1 Tax=Geoalkalibacter ferrihydriticus DSM 17813 TaxID=1121915 RepID=A0A0C2HLX9_9BACT|nr:hypothetical protein GFER_05910 [Geoalkalibacter ferrihydriticus DSM 17813]
MVPTSKTVVFSLKTRKIGLVSKSRKDAIVKTEMMFWKIETVFQVIRCGKSLQRGISSQSAENIESSENIIFA